MTSSLFFNSNIKLRGGKIIFAEARRIRSYRGNVIVYFTPHFVKKRQDIAETGTFYKNAWYMHQTRAIMKAVMNFPMP
jgi:hypothetical protein